MPLYLNLHLGIESSKAIEVNVLAGFPEDGFTDREFEIRSAYEAVYRLGYKIDFMSPLEIVIRNERVEDSLTPTNRKSWFPRWVESDTGN